MWLVQAQEAETKKRKRPKAPVGLGQLAAKKKKGTKGVSGLIDKWQAVRKDLVSHVLFRCCIDSSCWQTIATPSDLLPDLDSLGL